MAFIFSKNSSMKLTGYEFFKFYNIYTGSNDSTNFTDLICNCSGTLTKSMNSPNFLILTENVKLDSSNFLLVQTFLYSQNTY